MEEWRVIDSNPEYQVSNTGNIRRNQRILKLNPIKGGYLQIQLWKNAEYKMFMVGRLVALAFIPNPDGKKEVDHINRIRTDNRVENLRWVSAEENSQNRNVPLGKTGHRHITQHNNGYVCDIRRKNLKFYKTYPTLEEAITARDAFLTPPTSP